MYEVKEGDVLAGKYRIERVLGEGGMGVVVAAMHLQLDERVAIKFLLPGALHNPEAVARFAREARAAVKIKSEHVARVSDVGTLETGAPYMVMEFLQGRDLAAVLAHGGPLAPADAAEHVLQACEALAEAHALGIVHRDLKPANLFLAKRADGSPCVKVLDFGISKLTSASSSGADFGMTKTHAIMGSPLYMSPEQMSSTRSVDARADIWAVGAILYELTTGSVPFLADSMPLLCGMILQEAPLPPRARRPELPEAFDRLVLRCLEKDKNKRFQNVAELAVALAPFAPRNGTRSAQRIAKVLSAAGLSSSDVDVPPVSSGATASAATNPTESATHAWGKTLSTTGGRAIGVLIALVLMAGGGALALFFNAKSAAAPAASESASSPAPPVTVEARGAPSAAPEPSSVATPPPSVSTVITMPSVAPASSEPATPVAVRSAPPARPRPGTSPRPATESRPAAAPRPTSAAPAPKAEAPKPLNPLAGRQ
ncbi:MAG TPA: protein kinase [Polyangiaceae bacterium]